VFVVFESGLVDGAFFYAREPSHYYSGSARGDGAGLWWKFLVGALVGSSKHGGHRWES
jgi:hypothetical protein